MKPRKLKKRLIPPSESGFKLVENKRPLNYFRIAGLRKIGEDKPKPNINMNYQSLQNLPS